MKIILLFLVIVGFQNRVDGQQKLLLTIYYESKCSDSKYFILEQLVPTMNLMQEYLQLRFVPFGKAKSINQGLDGFECQHGPEECLGNKVQDCTIQLMTGQPDADILNYVACEMDSYAGTTGDLQCVPTAIVNAVNRCVNSPQGTDLQLFSEQLTNVIKPKFVPTVTVNEHFDQQTQDSAQTDLFGTLCSLLPEARPCANLYNHQALETFY